MSIEFSPQSERDRFERAFRQVLLSFFAVFLVNFSCLALTGILYRIVSIANILTCASLPFLLYSFSLGGRRLPSLFDRQRNLIVAVVVYLLTLISFVNQGVCNIWNVACPYAPIDDDRSPSDSDVDTDEFKFKAGLILLAAHGFSFVLNAWIVMTFTNILSSYLEQLDEIASLRQQLTQQMMPYKGKPNSFGKIEAENFYNMKKCLICHEALLDDDRVFVLHCKHVFHESCFKQWYTKGQFCPICRVKVENPQEQCLQDSMQTKKSTAVV